MEVIKLENAVKGKNSDKCKTLEYSFQNKEMDLGVATIRGRFPDKGYAFNEISKELVYVIEGIGTIYFENKRISFKPGDAILIEPKDKYYYESDYCVLSLTCNPAWNPNQHKIV